MKKGIITAVALLIVTPALILFVFGIGGNMSAYTNDSFAELPSNDEEYIFTSYKIGVEKPIINTYESDSYYSELVTEQSMFVPNEIKSMDTFNWEVDDVLLAYTDFNDRMPTANITPSVIKNTPVSEVSGKITDMIEFGLQNSREPNAPTVDMDVSLKQAYRYEPVKIVANVDGGAEITNVLMFIVLKSDMMAKKNGDDRYYINVFKNTMNSYYGVYLHPFGGPLGKYDAVLYIQTKNGAYAYKTEFSMKGRPSPKPKETKKILVMEYNADLSSKKIPSLDGGTTSYEGIYDWTRYMKCDIFWILAGQTTGWHNSVNKNNPWMSATIKNAEILAASTNRKDVQFGTYIMAYSAPGGGDKKAGYDASITYNTATKSLGRSRHISLGSEDRLNDIIDLLHRYDKNPNVSYLGLDFIRTGRHDGYELVDEMVAFTGVYTPKNWSKMSKDARMVWLARMRFSSREINMKWRWFRAQKVANIVKKIKESGVKKPLWVFTLGWDHGQEHGQDPYMFFDAGVDYDAIMIYEANRAQHKTMLKQWPAYLAGEYNVIVGNMVDNRLQDGSRRAEIEYMKRLYETESLYNRTSRIRGIFFFDMARMMWSKNRGRTGVKEWANINASVVSRIEEKYSENPVSLNIALHEKNRTGVLTITNITHRNLNDMAIVPIAGVGLNRISLDADIVSLKGRDSIQIPFRYTYSSNGRRSSLITFRLKTKEGIENVVVAYTLLHTLNVIERSANTSGKSKDADDKNKTDTAKK